MRNVPEAQGFSVASTCLVRASVDDKEQASGNRTNEEAKRLFEK